MPDPLDQPVARRVMADADDGAEPHVTDAAGSEDTEAAGDGRGERVDEVGQVDEVDPVDAADEVPESPGDDVDPVDEVDPDSDRPEIKPVEPPAAEPETTPAGGRHDPDHGPVGAIARAGRPAAAAAATLAVEDTEAEEAGDSPARPAGAPAGKDRRADGQDDGAGDGDGTGKAGARGKTPRSRARVVLEWAAVIGGALLVALVVRSTLAQAFWIPSPSMEPTLQEGDRVLVNKLSYRLHDVHRGDIVVFERPPAADSLDPSHDIPDLIKRVIGLPGDIIEARADGVVYINDHRLDEPYLPDDTRTGNLPRQQVPEGEVFVMGDNRSNSSDSREFGPIDEDLIVGRAFIRIWPLDDIGGL